tara:strand:- start:2168 stop:2362 length:195 start_codon:yes stop_codon:yes gene_type:complete
MIEIKLTKKEFKMLRYIFIFTTPDPLTTENLSELLKETVTEKDIDNLFRALNNTKDLREAGLFK